MSQDAPDTPTQLPKRTTPTWETELLLSGATVFALFQAAQALLAWAAYLLPRLDDGLLMISGMLYTYGQGGVVLLAMTFSVHLMLRAYWVAMVGIDSVFPSGLRIDQVRAGPLAKALLLERWQDMAAAIERADNRATIVFAVGVSMAMVLIPVSLTVLLMFALSYAIAWALGDVALVSWLLLAVMAAWFTPYLLVTLVDKQWGARLEPGSRGYRACMALHRFYARVGMARDFNPMVTIFSSNIGERKGTIIVFMVLLVAMLSSTAGLVLSRQTLGVGSYGAFPDVRRGMPASSDGRHYGSAHGAGFAPAVPFIPDLVATGHYVALVVPYVPKAHAHLLGQCDATARQSGDNAGGEFERERKSRQRLLQCLADGFSVSLDGVPVTLTPEWYTDPGRDLRGLLFMLPARDLAPGRHELSVLPRAESPPVEGEEPEPAYLIPFWR
jgi:hypothetical protein